MLITVTISEAFAQSIAIMGKTVSVFQAYQIVVVILEMF
jgi:hypothetical protein